MRRHTPRHRQGFTLVKVLIVVVILGILAATVLPQFTTANTDAQQAALVQNLQTLRSQIMLYKFQHGNVAPAFGATTSITFTNAMLLSTDSKGNTGAIGTLPYGPYLVGQIPANPFTGGKGISIVPSIATAVPDESMLDGINIVGWLYSPSEGRIKGNNTGVASDGVTLLQNL